jgi:DNA-binding LacI/PurR family transcriptional regulator
MTSTAVRMLMGHVAGEELGGERRLMQAELKVRGSTRPRPGTRTRSERPAAAGRRR